VLLHKDKIAAEKLYRNSAAVPRMVVMVVHTPQLDCTAIYHEVTVLDLDLAKTNRLRYGLKRVSTVHEVYLKAVEIWSLCRPFAWI
jgi:hypothetical protein